MTEIKCNKWIDCFDETDSIYVTSMVFYFQIIKKYDTNVTAGIHLISAQEHTWLDNKVCELTTVCLPWQHWKKALVWFDDIDISAFQSCVVVDLWQSLSEWHLLLSACVLLCCRENVGAWIRAVNEH